MKFILLLLLNLTTIVMVAQPKRIPLPDFIDDIFHDKCLEFKINNAFVEYFRLCSSKYAKIDRIAPNYYSNSSYYACLLTLNMVIESCVEKNVNVQQFLKKPYMFVKERESSVKCPLNVSISNNYYGLNVREAINIFNSTACNSACNYNKQAQNYCSLLWKINQVKRYNYNSDDSLYSKTKNNFTKAVDPDFLKILQYSGSNDQKLRMPNKAYFMDFNENESVEKRDLSLDKLKDDIHLKTDRVNSEADHGKEQITNNNKHPTIHDEMTSNTNLNTNPNQISLSNKDSNNKNNIKHVSMNNSSNQLHSIAIIHSTGNGKNVHKDIIINNNDSNNSNNNVKKNFIVNNSNNYVNSVNKMNNNNNDNNKNNNNNINSINKNNNNENHQQQQNNHEEIGTVNKEVKNNVKQSPELPGVGNDAGLEGVKDESVTQTVTSINEQTEVSDQESQINFGERHQIEPIFKPAHEELDDVADDLPEKNDIGKQLAPESEQISKSSYANEFYSGDSFFQTEDSHFSAYFLMTVSIVIIGYIIYHNKNKIVAFALEGRRHRSGRRRPMSAAYRKLDCNLEEAISSNPSHTSVTHVVY